MDRNELRDGYAEWLGRFDWEWFITLTFRGYPSLRKTERLLDRWIAELKRGNGTARFGFFFVLESGASGENHHFHGFVLGLRDATDRLTWMRRWFEMGGEARIEYFKEGGNATNYTVKTLRPGIEDNIIFDLPGALRHDPATVPESTNLNEKGEEDE